MERFNKIILNIPHSSTFIPLNTWEGNIEEEIKKWTDTYCDILFNPHKDNRVVPVVFPYSRFYCDAERLPNDEPMEKIGQGYFYTKFNDCTRKDDSLFKMSVNLAYFSHRFLLSYLINSNDYENTLLIDCHSFSNEIAPEVDVCIGWNENETKPSEELIENIKNYFSAYGYNVSFNHPYSNSISPPSEKKYKSLMIEVNKKLYLDENGKKLGSMYKLNQCINYLYKNILDKWNY